MSLSTGTYLIFLTACLILHELLPKRFRNVSLLLASVAFFLYAMPTQTVVMLLLCLGVYFLGRMIHAYRGKKQRILTVFGILLVIGILVVYKYVPFLASLFGSGSRDGGFSFVAPLGISYVTFQCIAYLTEVYRGNMEPETDPVDLLVYLLFFAKLTAGPIEAPASFLAQLKQPRACTVSDAKRAFLRIAMGFVKKIAVADVVAPCVNAVYAGPAPSGWESFLAIVLYTVQILYDFSGYTDIARGSAALFGIRLTENFNAPYRARSIREFWKRWHISLTTWLRTYVFFPLGGSRVSTWKRYRNILIVFLVSGIWHGASVTYVVWGLMHGLIQIGEMLLDRPTERLCSRVGISRNGPVLSALAWVRTMTLVGIGWVFFRASSLEGAVSVLAGLFGSWGSLGSAMERCGMDWTVLALALSGIVCAAGIDRRLSRDKGSSAGETLVLCAASAWAVMLLWLVNAASGVVSSFIYFEF